jgi:hypothetical protein
MGGFLRGWVDSHNKVLTHKTKNLGFKPTLNPKKLLTQNIKKLNAAT